jgi:predicted anti-sigma-YlaC factor YlaD
MNCNEMNTKLPDLLFETEAVKAEGARDVEMHLASCGDCRKQLAELRATMALMDTWEVPEPNPYFMTRLNARLEEERQAVPAGWFERLRARLAYGSRLTLRPVAAMALTAVVLVGGGAYLELNHLETPVDQPVQAAVVHDLQTMDNNAQLLDQLESLSDQNDDQSGTSQVGPG